jgi:hypothetical protein
MKFTAVLAALATTFTLALPTQAATFVGYDTLYNANDLTVIDDNGTLLDFLDLPLTQGTTVSGALGAYGNAGFAVATYDQLLLLFGAFSITNAPTTLLEGNNNFSPTVSSVNSFNQALGVTLAADGSLGSFDRGQGQFGFY